MALQAATHAKKPLVSTRTGDARVGWLGRRARRMFGSADVPVTREVGTDLRVGRVSRVDWSRPSRWLYETRSDSDFQYVNAGRPADVQSLAPNPLEGIMKKSLKTLAIISGIVVCIVVGVVGLGALYLLTATDVPVTDADKRLIVRAVDLAPYFEGYSPDENFESFEKLRYIDQSEELNYDYDSTKEGEPCIAATVTYERNKSDANTTYAMSWSAQRLGIGLADGGIGIKENNSFFSAGDRSRFAEITYGGNTVGHLLVVQKGKSVYSFAISGFAMGDPAIWHDLFDARIAQLNGN